MGSFDVVRYFKRHLPGDPGRIGHFGTLDPFACGVLLIGVGGAARLNDLVHAHLPKTYLAVGKIGIETDTGDWEGRILQEDRSRYLNEVIASFDQNFIQETIAKKFLGVYWQAPHTYSATKFQGRPLHEWAREGVEIKKEPVKRFVHNIEVVRWSFPYLSVRVKVSSGTYVRTLFSDIARELGTIGSLIALQRESIGEISQKFALKMKNWPEKDLALPTACSPEELLPFKRWNIPAEREKAFLNGLTQRLDLNEEWAWGMGQDGSNWGLLKREGAEWKVAINFRASQQAGHTL
jgi:tRNA pseudouridine55 synthase